MLRQGGVALGAVLLLASACSLDWSEGAAPSGKDGGSDGEAGSGGSRAADAGDGPEAGSDGGSAGSDGGMGGSGGSEPPAVACTEDVDCVDTERFACKEHACVEFECHASKACPTGVCTQHACIEFVPPERRPTGYSQISGGGLANSNAYELRWSAGVPQPFGSASSAKYRLALGPGAGRP